MAIQLRAINWWEQAEEAAPTQATSGPAWNEPGYVASGFQQTPTGQGNAAQPATPAAPKFPDLSEPARQRFESLMADPYTDRAKFDQAYNALRWDNSLTEQDRQFLNSFEQDVVKSYSFKKDGEGWKNVNPLAAGAVRRQIESQYKSAPERFKGGVWEELGPDQVLDEMATTLAKSGVTDLRDIGQAEVNGKTVFVNKKTGKPLDHNYGERGGENFWSGSYQGEGNTGYTIAGYEADGTPILATVGQSSSDLHKLAPILAIASFIPGVAPFAQALNAGISLSQGDLLGAALSAVGSANGFGVGSIGGVPMSTINTGASGIRAARAVERGDIWGAVSAGAALLPSIGVDAGAAKDIGRWTSRVGAVDRLLDQPTRRPAATRPQYAEAIQRTARMDGSGWSSDPLIFDSPPVASARIPREEMAGGWF